MSELQIYKEIVKKMKDDEIKEIIKETKKLVDNSDYKNCYNYHIFFKVEHIAKLLDYITNLQQEVEKLNEDKRGMLVELYKANDKRDKLQEENEKLKQADKNTYETSQEIMAELTRENERLKKENEMLEINKVVNIANYVKDMADYKSRCEKADWWLREMLKQAKTDEAKAIINGTLDLLLNGRSDE